MAQGNIVQYNSPIDKLTPESQGDEALARAGRTIGGLGHEEGEDYQRTIDLVGGQAAQAIDQHETMAEISQGSAALAAMHNNFTTQWNQTTASTDANDKSIQGKFLDGTVEPQLQQFQDGFSTERGQQWAMSQADAMRMHYTEKTSADMSTRAGDAKMEDMKTTLTNLSATAHKDWTSMGSSLQQVDALLAADKEGSQGLLDPAQIARLDDYSRDMKNEIVKSGIQGLADKDPDHAKAVIASGQLDGYMSGTEMDQLSKYADGVKRSKIEDQNLAYQQEERAQKQQEEAAANKLLNDAYDPKTGSMSFSAGTVQSIFSNPDLSAKAKVDMIGMVKHISQDTDITDPDTRTENFKALGDGTLTQSDLIAQAGAGKISKEDLSFFNGRLDKTPDAVAANKMLSNAVQQAQKTIVTPAGPGAPVTPDQRQKETEFTNWFTAAYQSGMNDPQFKGMTQSQKAQILLSTTDPKGLLNPQNMMGFMSSPQQMLQDGMKGVGPLPSGLGTPNTSNGIKITAPAAADVAALRANPSLAARYDKVFGAGEAAKILGSK